MENIIRQNSSLHEKIQLVLVLYSSFLLISGLVFLNQKPKTQKFDLWVFFSQFVMICHGWCCVLFIGRLKFATFDISSEVLKYSQYITLYLHFMLCFTSMRPIFVGTLKMSHWLTVNNAFYVVQGMITLFFVFITSNILVFMLWKDGCPDLNQRNRERRRLEEITLISPNLLIY